MINYIKDLITAKILKGDKLSRNMYAVNQGSYRGEFFVYINKDTTNYYFLSLPDNKSIIIPITEFELGLQEKVIELLEKIPKNVYEICIAQYNESKSKDNINRLKQPPSSSRLDRRERKS